MLYLYFFLILIKCAGDVTYARLIMRRSKISIGEHVCSTNRIKQEINIDNKLFYHSLYILLYIA